MLQGCEDSLPITGPKALTKLKHLDLSDAYARREMYLSKRMPQKSKIGFASSEEKRKISNMSN
ncbi:MAG TPA: hypothetical protein DCS30_11225 [Rhizobiales bacterium]|nr:hypothetical protein [Hyphomicrobiales bacterium]